MIPSVRCEPNGARRGAGVAICWMTAAALLGAADVVASTAPAASSPAASAAMVAAAASSPKPPRAPGTEVGASWQELTPAQHQFLQPLAADWAGLEMSQKRKWLALTARVPKMSADERARIQARMTTWAKLTPLERGQARLRYQETRQLPALDRQARWNEYQSLPPEQKKQFAVRASLAASAPDTARRPLATGPRGEKTPRDATQPKSNIVATPGLATSPRPVAPTLVQARPGATTTLINRPPPLPTHQQTGMPKIAATPEFVNKSTLLPQRGPQSAAAAAPGADTASGPEPAARP